MNDKTRALGILSMLMGLCAASAAAQAQPEAPAVATPPPSASAVPTDTAPTGPTLEMPPEASAPPAAPVASVPPVEPAQAEPPALQLGVSSDDDRTLARGLTPARLAQNGTVIGGYGQFNLTSLKVGPSAPAETTANVRRIVLFLAHRLNDDIQIYTELEWENALACASCSGSAEVEQAFVQWKLAGDALALRAGLLLLPMGIINQWHEPPVFNGVERPETDQFIIPSTWRELGFGISGDFSELYHYELYLTTTLDPSKLGPGGIGGSSDMGSLAAADAFAVTGRFEVEPWLGVIAGAAFFASEVGANADYFGLSGGRRDLALPVLGYALDARARRFGFDARVLWTQFFLPNSGDLMAALHADGSPFFPNAASSGAVPERTHGGYVELAYNVLHLVHTAHQLLAFMRLETYDMQAAVPKGFARKPELGVDVLTAGLTYRPISQLAFKADFQLRDRRLGYDELQLDAGFGYMF